MTVGPELGRESDMEFSSLLLAASEASGRRFLIARSLPHGIRGWAIYGTIRASNFDQVVPPSELIESRPSPSRAPSAQPNAGVTKST